MQFVLYWCVLVRGGHWWPPSPIHTSIAYEHGLEIHKKLLIIAQTYTLCPCTCTWCVLWYMSIHVLTHYNTTHQGWEEMDEWQTSLLLPLLLTLCNSEWQFCKCCQRAPVSSEHEMETRETTEEITYVFVCYIHIWVERFTSSCQVAVILCELIGHMKVLFNDQHSPNPPFTPAKHSHEKRNYLFWSQHCVCGISFLVATPTCIEW